MQEISRDQAALIIGYLIGKIPTPFFSTGYPRSKVLGRMSGLRLETNSFGMLKVANNPSAGIIKGPLDLGFRTDVSQLVNYGTGFSEALDILGFIEEEDDEDEEEDPHVQEIDPIDFLEGADQFSRLIVRNADKMNITMGLTAGEEIDREGYYVLRVCEEPWNGDDETDIIFDQDPLNDDKPTCHIGRQANLLMLAENFRDRMKAYLSLHGHYID